MRKKIASLMKRLRLKKLLPGKKPKRLLPLPKQKPNQKRKKNTTMKSMMKRKLGQIQTKKLKKQMMQSMRSIPNFALSITFCSKNVRK